jgi:hypothetical protein
MAPRESHSRKPADKALPYSLVRAAALELCALVETGEADDWVLDLAWLGLERPNPEPREGGAERLTVWMSLEESTALREFIDGEPIALELAERAARKVSRALGETTSGRTERRDDHVHRRQSRRAPQRVK